MKKQIKKLNLNKRTITNLNAGEMNRQVGGNPTQGNCTQGNCGQTLHGPTCGSYNWGCHSCQCS